MILDIQAGLVGLTTCWQHDGVVSLGGKSRISEQSFLHQYWIQPECHDQVMELGRIS
jgi:hypothetical protein